MKRLTYLSALLCAAVLAGCSNEELMEDGAAMQQNEQTLIATTGADTRTVVNAKYVVTWSKGDAFYAFGKKVSDEASDKVYSSTGTFTLKNGTDSGTGTFEGAVTGDKAELEYAVYPSGNYTPSTMTLTFPTAYTYPASNAPMFGKLNDAKNKVEFTQLLSGLVRIQVSGIDGGKSGTLKLSATGIAGTATLTPGATATLGELSSTAGEVTLSFTTPAESTDPLILDIPVPAKTYSSGITATLQIGGAAAQVFKTTASFVVEAGVAKEMRPIQIVEITGSTINFSQPVADVEAANEALAEGVKNITIASVSSDETINIPTSSTTTDPVTINIASTNNNTFTVQGPTDGGSTPAAVINVPQNTTGTLTVKDIDHVELNGGSWTKVTAKTGENTLEIKDGTVITELVIEKGAVKIASGAKVDLMRLNADAAINECLNIAAGHTMTINVGSHTLTMKGTPYHSINGKLILKGASEESKGKIEDETKGLYLTANSSALEMENIVYTSTGSEAYGIGVLQHLSNVSVKVEKCEMTGKYYCFSTNASTEVGSKNNIILTDSKFAADETPLMLNIPATLTATGCTFTGGWQAAFLRGGTSTFSGCAFNLKVTSYGSSNITAGAASWGSGNQAPSAAITIGNRGGTAYNYAKIVTLQNCTFSVTNNKNDQTYPSIFIDANQDKEEQKVTFSYDNTSKSSFESAGTGLDIRNTTGEVTVNNVAYHGSTGE